MGLTIPARIDSRSCVSVATSGRSRCRSAPIRCIRNWPLAQSSPALAKTCLQIFLITGADAAFHGVEDALRLALQLPELGIELGLDLDFHVRRPSGSSAGRVPLQDDGVTEFAEQARTSQVVRAHRLAPRSSAARTPPQPSARSACIECRCRASGVPHRGRGEPCRPRIGNFDGRTDSTRDGGYRRCGQSG